MPKRLAAGTQLIATYAWVCNEVALFPCAKKGPVLLRFRLNLFSGLTALAVTLLGPGVTFAAEAPACGGGLAWPGESHLDLKYEIFLSGIRVGSIDVTAALAPQTYSITAETRSRGPIDPLIHFRSRATTRGHCSPVGPAAETHNADNMWRGEERWVRAAFLPDGTVDAKTQPDAKGDKREPVPRPEQTGATDPITAGLVVALSAGGMPESGGAVACNSAQKVFDGRRLYELTLSRDEAWPGDTRKKDGPDAVCKLSYLRLGGRSADPWWPAKDEPRDAKVEYRQLTPGLPPLPTRVVSSAGLARLVIELKDLKIQP